MMQAQLWQLCFA